MSPYRLISSPDTNGKHGLTRWIGLIGWLLITTNLLAQPAPPDELQAESTTEMVAAGITVLGNPTLSFSSPEDYANGVTIDHTTLRLTLTPGLRWSLQVRASGDLYSGAYSIPISALRLQPIGISGNSAILTLSTADQSLISGLLTNVLTLTPTFRYTTVGGAAVLKPSGNYSTTLTFTFTPL